MPRQPLAGGCACGAIRYEIAQDPFVVYVCHCTDCQGITSSAFSIGMVIADAGFSVTGREPRAVTGGRAESGRVKHRFICPDCGTWLFGQARPGTEFPGMVRIVRGGTLDDTSWLRPSAHYWVRSKQPWIALPDGVTVFQTQPE